MKRSLLLFLCGTVFFLSVCSLFKNDATEEVVQVQLTEIIEPTATPFDPIKTGTTETVAVPTLTPTATPNPYIFGDFVDMSTGNFMVRFESEGFDGIELKASLISPANLGGYDNTSEGLALGNNTGVIRPDKYNNLLIGLHSGYFRRQRLEAEPLRLNLEKWGKLSDNDVLERMRDAIGSRGKILVNDLMTEIEVVGIVRVDHDAAEKIQLTPEDVLDIATDEKTMLIGDVNPFKIAKSGKYLMINFCGWGPNEEPTFYRYLILLKPTKPLHVE